ncbi:hypothetical protein H9W90_10325 [Polaribacter pectinis]|uniref:Uncharacterized protein n=1 Tax=Polaribacter pectinis TaxID=2738844 RepID=A0A7G9L7J3_9FLAO|nr:hypothetical protein [Polaribacter pectinis]QNM84592.1 hypothetical protein H9W90_10325 [Polaribacter pectinis]
MIKCIVKNDMYEVDIFDEETNTPTNTVIVDRCKWSRLYNDYELHNGVVVNLKGRYKESGLKRLVFNFKGVILKEVVTRNFQSYADYLNMFHNMEQEELEKLILKAQNETKTILEEEIEELKLQKIALEEELETYLEIQQKREEINELIKKLDC